MQVIRPAVKANPRMPIRAWLANGCLIECGDQVADEVQRRLPSWVVGAALAIGVLIGWGLR